MKLYRVTENANSEQNCYIIGTPYFADPQNKHSIVRSLYDMITLKNDHWKRPLIQAPKEYL